MNLSEQNGLEENEGIINRHIRPKSSAPLTLGEVPVLRISFAKVLEMVQGLWRFLECAEGVLNDQQARLIVRQAMRQLAEELVPKRRQRALRGTLRGRNTATTPQNKKGRDRLPS